MTHQERKKNRIRTNDIVLITLSSSKFSGKVILHTTYGDISIELWPKEAPKACRNFVQLCMEGYYNDTIFHRIVANFIVQGGDPEGTGLGGESIYEGGRPFVDEFHSRLRFVRRGLVAMANSGVPNDNRSQFFITLDATMELQNKHTIFGKVICLLLFSSRTHRLITLQLRNNNVCIQEADDFLHVTDRGRYNLQCT